MYDSHAHVISDDLAAFPAMDAADPAVAARLRDPYTAETLLRDMDDAGVNKALLVQRGQIYGFDNRYILAAAGASGGRLKAVCGVDAADPGCGAAVRRLREQGAAGVRLMARLGERSFGWLDGEHAEGFWRAAVDCALPVCVHFFSWNREEGLERLERLLDRHPVAHLVIDHLTNAPIASAAECGIDAPVRRLSERASVTLKFTAIPLNDLAERGIDAGQVLKAYLALFGADRLLWGSDVTQSRGGYGEMVTSGRAAVAGFPADVRDRLLQANVARIYDL